MSAGSLRVLELYCGIGGLAAALQPAAGVTEIVAAVDVNRLATDVYCRNFPDHQVVTAVVESVAAESWRRWNADLWWLSPPCQPFTRRGNRRDLADPRTATLLAVLERLAEIRPRYVALENVPPFRGSGTHGRWLRTLERSGYTAVRETVLCPTELGIPNRRRRYYLVAGRVPRLLPFPAPRQRSDSSAVRPLAGYLDRHPSPQLDVDPGLVARYPGALDIVDAGDPDAVTACFTSAYGRSPVRSGSYLAKGPTDAIRRFSPAEILRLLGFPGAFRLACGLPGDESPVSSVSIGNAWRLAGNSLSIAAVRTVLAAIPELAAALGSSADG
ncbi:MAG: DNA cytosine methyltransferase [Thermoanaerobaculia bacterium]